MKQSKKLALSVTVAVAAVTLVANVIAAANNVSGYEQLQSAAFALSNEPNYSMHSSMNFSYDGKALGKQTTDMRKLNDGEEVIKTKSEPVGEKATESEVTIKNGMVSIDGSDARKNVVFKKGTGVGDAPGHLVITADPGTMDGLSISGVQGDIDKLPADSEIRVEIQKAMKDRQVVTGEGALAHTAVTIATPSGAMLHEKFQMTETQKRFVKALMDLLVGDAKNYFTNDNGTISVKLEGNQIPEIAQLGLAAATEAIRKTSDEMKGQMNDSGLSASEKPFKDLENLNNIVFQNMSVTAKLDDNGKISSISGTLAFEGTDNNGASHTASVVVEANISDYGTTK